MRYMALDIGKKKIGIALSDEGGKVAFPEAIILNDGKAIDTILTLAKEKKVVRIVLGESLSLDSKPNPIQKEVEHYRDLLQQGTETPVSFIREFFSSSEARWATKREKPVATPHRSTNQLAKKRENVDAKAAAIILQRYLDTVQLE